jgi:NAD(P)-dependent dehydrogenase (short-subunit alcohol dehydrogenase family)
MTLPMAHDDERYGTRAVTATPGAFTTPMTRATNKKDHESTSPSRDLLFPMRVREPREFAQMVRWAVECPYV